MEKTVKFKKNENIKLVAAIGVFVNTMLEDDKEYTLTIKEYKPKRSLNANSYAWSLIDKLAVKLKQKKTDIYREYVKEVGGNSYLICMQEKAADDFIKIWASNGLGWIAEPEPSKLERCINVRAYYGSSQFDTSQMWRMINLIIQDCKENEIETLTHSELERLCSEWEGGE